MLVDDKIYLGTSTKPEYLALKYANRHGLVTGATGTGKTVSLQIMAEGSSRAGVPVDAAVTSFTRTIANRLGSALVRGILGGLKRGR